MANDWTTSAREELLRLRGPDTGWGERGGDSPRVEPTALACLGLLAARDGGPPHEPEAVRKAAAWLAKVQRPDGSLGISATIATPNWTTPYGLLIWSALSGFSGPIGNAKRWLLRQEGMTFVDELEIFGHDPTITGWPWAEGTHSWVEPTALAVLSLRRLRLADHLRARDGLRLIRNRVIAPCGWNYGNNAIFGRNLRPQPAPTGLALLALAGVDKPTAVIERSIAYLEATLPAVRSAASLGWGLLGLRAWDRAPKEADRWLAETHARVTGRPDGAPRLGLLLLASGDQSLALCGLTRG